MTENEQQQALAAFPECNGLYEAVANIPLSVEDIAQLPALNTTAKTASARKSSLFDDDDDDDDLFDRRAAPKVSLPTISNTQSAKGMVEYEKRMFMLVK